MSGKLIWEHKSAGRYKHMIHDIEPLLEFSGEWTTTDLDREGERTIYKLCQAGAIERVDRDDKGGSYRNVYRWNQEAKQEFQQILDSIDTFPCGHRVHIHNSRDTPQDMLECKHCGETYRKEFVRQYL